MTPTQYNFVGRILGPRGMTAKQLEHETGCKIMVRGKGSMRDRKKVRTPISGNIMHLDAAMSLTNLQLLMTVNVLAVKIIALQYLEVN